MQFASRLLAKKMEGALDVDRHQKLHELDKYPVGEFLHICGTIITLDEFSMSLVSLHGTFYVTRTRFN